MPAARPQSDSAGADSTFSAIPVVGRAASLSGFYSPVGGTVSTVVSVGGPAGVARRLSSRTRTAQRSLYAAGCLAPGRRELRRNLRLGPVLVVSDHLDELFKVLTGIRLHAFSPIGLRRCRSRRKKPSATFRMPIAAQPTKAVQCIAQQARERLAKTMRDI